MLYLIKEQREESKKNYKKRRNNNCDKVANRGVQGKALPLGFRVVFLALVSFSSTVSIWLSSWNTALERMQTWNT